MKKFNYLLLPLILLAMTLTSCEAIGDIFQAGMIVGIVVVIIVVILIIWMVSKVRR